MTPAKWIARNLVFPLVYETGIHKLLYKDGRRGMVLMYHGVNNDGGLRYNGRHISETRFDRHLEYLKKNFRIVSLDTMFKAYRSGQPFSGDTIAITFDDGFENNFTHAFPLIKKHQVPVTFFVSSVCLEEENAILWPDLCDVLRVESGRTISHGGYHFTPYGYDWRDNEKHQYLSDYIKHMGYDSRTNFIDFVREKFSFDELLTRVDKTQWKLLNRAQIKEMADCEYVEIASHAHHHYNLAMIPPEDAFSEITKSREILEEAINKKVVSIAFPDGNYDERIKKYCLDAGYENLCAVRYLLPGDSEDQSILPRHGISSTTNYYSNIIHLYKSFSKDGFS
ncbi:MAG: polysaccharide deacetylase family protein [Flavobacteriales bacterium]|nr:polysaccharide deacetylase family protein [Flavobacteriales bacterium]